MPRVTAAVLSASNAAALAGSAVAVVMTTVVARAFGGPDWLAALLVAGAALLVFSGFDSIPTRLRNTAFLLFGLTILLAPLADAPFAAIRRGVFISSQLLALISSVLLLAQCGLQSPRVQRVGASLRGQPPSRRYLSFTIASQLYSSTLSMAGAHIMLLMAAPPEDPPGAGKTEAVLAVTRGFAVAGFWSPVFGNMTILLALYPSLRWGEIFPMGVMLAQVALTVGIVLNRLERRRAPLPPSATESTRPADILLDGLPLLLAMMIFMGVILIVGRLLALPISATIVMLVPPTALLIHLTTGAPGARWQNARRNIGASVRSYPRLASEALLFMAAGCAGSIMADAFPPHWTLQIGTLLNGQPFLGVAFLIFSIMGIALAGVHPVLTSVFLASTITPEVLGLPAVAHMGALLTGWGLSAVLTPFSVLSLTAGRYAGTSLYQISFGMNWRWALVTSLVAGVLLTIVAAVAG